MKSEAAKADPWKVLNNATKRVQDLLQAELKLGDNPYATLLYDE